LSAARCWPSSKTAVGCRSASPERSVAHASLLILGLYNKLVKQFGSDFTDRRSVS
jgi:hypothetical protein